MAFYNTMVHNRECEIEYHREWQEDSTCIWIDKVLQGGVDITDKLGRQTIMWLEEEIFNEVES